MPWNRPYGGSAASRPVITAFVALAGVAAAVLIGREGLTTVPGCGLVSDPHPSQTARDWVTHADHVVVASPQRERESNRRDFASGQYRYQTDRTVTFRVDEVLWSSTARPDRPVAKGFDMTAPGWRVYRANGHRAKRTAADAPRLEIGHTYLLALRWGPEGWNVLGEGAAVPFDDGVADRGEWCGRVLSEGDVARGELFSRKADNSLEKAILGEDARTVKSLLERAARK
ncbi:MULTISPECIES: hypothetical protein [unclassified Streptomyces]|uniref:hypothetical protein n=1 Tax=unclassified Streptomyces TaxID=2593676 RepID=UPI0036EB0A8F